MILKREEAQADSEQQLLSKNQQLSHLRDELEAAKQNLSKNQIYPPNAYGDFNHELHPPELNSCLNISDQINTTIEQNDYRPPMVAKPITSKKESRDARAEKKSSKETLKK